MKIIINGIIEKGLINSLKSSTVFRFFICNLFYSANLWLTLAYYPVYFNRLGISDKRIGILISAISFITLLLVFPFGVMSDRLRPKTLLRIGAFLLAMSNILVVFGNGFYFIFGVVILWGAGSTLFIITLSSLFYKHVTEIRRGIRIALFTLGGALGFGLGPFVGGFIIKYYEISNVFIVAGVMNIILLFMVSLLKSTKPIKFHIDMYRKDLLKPDVIFVLVLVFFMSSHFGVEETCLTLFMTKTIGLTGVQVGTIFICVGSWIAALNLVAGHFFDKSKLLILLLSLSVLVSGLFQTFTAYAGTFTELLSLRLAHTIGDGFFLVLRAVIVTMVFPNKRMGGNFGCVYAVHTGALTVAALISGFLSSRYGYAFPFMASGLTVTAVALVLLLSRKRIERLFEHNSTG